MTLSIGRFGLDPTTVEATSWDHDGDVINVGGLIKATTMANAYILRDQGLGLANNPDEPWVPLIESLDPTLDGMVRVLDFSCQRIPVLTDQHYTIPFKARVYRFPGGFSAPDAEEVLVGYTRSNGHGLDATNTRPWHAVPAAALAYTHNSTHNAVNQVIPAADTTGGVVHRDGSTGSNRNIYFSKRANFQLPPGNWYDSGCLITVGGAAIVGRQVPSAQNTTAWMLTNHVMSVQSGTADGIFKYKWWDGSTWISKNFALTNSTSFSNYRYPTVGFTVLRNGPEAAGVRLTFDLPSGNYARSQLDLYLRRGSRVADGYFSADTKDKWGVERVESEVSSLAVSGTGCYATTAANKYFIVAAAGNDFSTLGAVHRDNNDSALSFGIGMAISGATDAMELNSLIYSYFSPSGTRQTVVAK